VIPEGMTLLELRRNRPPGIEAGLLRSELHKWFAAKRSFDIARCEGAGQEAARKLVQAERHLARLREIERLRQHLYGFSGSDGREYMLGETRAEAVLAVEAAAATVYSALDIFSHLVDEVYALEQGRHSATFARVAYTREGSASCLQSRYPQEALTIFLVAERERWIGPLEAWRHATIHHECLSAVEVAGGPVLILPPDTESPLLDVRDAVPAVDLVAEWVGNLQHVLNTSVDLMAKWAGHQAIMPEETHPVGHRNPALALVSGSPHLEPLVSFLENWLVDEKVVSDKFRRMFWQIAKDWARQWGFDRFRQFVQNRPLTDYRIGRTTAVTDPVYGEIHHIEVHLNLDAGKSSMWFALAPVRPVAVDRYRLVPTSLSTPLSRVRRTCVRGFDSRQSGRESGHSDIIFAGEVANISDDYLSGIRVHVLRHPFPLGSVEVGDLPPGAVAEFTWVFESGCMPIGDSFPAPSADLLMGDRRVDLRVTYGVPTEEGVAWCEEHCFGAPKQRPGPLLELHAEAASEADG
jgi:hypothetical protein